MFDISTNPKRKYFLIAFLSATILFVCISSMIVYSVLLVNKGFFNFSKNNANDDFFTKEPPESITATYPDPARRLYYPLFASSEHGISFYYPHTHHVIENEYSILAYAHSAGVPLSSNFSDIGLTIFNVAKIKRDGEIDSSIKDKKSVLKSVLEKYHAHYFKEDLFEEVAPLYKDKIFIQSTEYDIESLRSKSYLRYLVSWGGKECSSDVKHNVDVIYLNEDFYAVINYQTGFVCDPTTGRSTIPITFDEKEMDLTYKIFDSLKFRDNDTEISEFKRTNTFDYYRNKLNELSSDLGINIYYDTYPDDLVNDFPGIRWKKTNLEVTFDNAYVTNHIKILYKELSKYPKKLIQASKVKNIILVHDLEFLSGSSVRNSKINGYSFYDKNTIILDIFKANLHDVAFYRDFLRELMHFIDENNFKAELKNDSFWSVYNESEKYVGYQEALNPNSYMYDPDNYLIKGYATGYAKVSVSEDRSETFCLLMNPSDFKHLKYKQQNDPRFAKKVEALRKQLSSIVPEMDEDYFKKLTYEEI